MVFVVDSLIWVVNNNNNQRASFFKVQYVEWHSIRRTSVGCVKPSITMTAYYNYIMSLLFWSVLYRRLKTLYSRHMHCSFLLSHCVLADRFFHRCLCQIDCRQCGSMCTARTMWVMQTTRQTIKLPAHFTKQSDAHVTETYTNNLKSVRNAVLNVQAWT